jgi:hypothetical protein
MVSVGSLHELPDELRDPIRRGIEREMTRIEYMDFGIAHVAAVGRTPNPTFGY